MRFLSIDVARSGQQPWVSLDECEYFGAKIKPMNDDAVPLAHRDLNSPTAATKRPENDCR